MKKDDLEEGIFLVRHEAFFLKGLNRHLVFTSRPKFQLPNTKQNSRQFHIQTPKFAHTVREIPGISI